MLFHFQVLNLHHSTMNRLEKLGFMLFALQPILERLCLNLRLLTFFEQNAFLQYGNFLVFKLALFLCYLPSLYYFFQKALLFFGQVADPVDHFFFLRFGLLYGLFCSVELQVFAVRFGHRFRRVTMSFYFGMKLIQRAQTVIL